MVPGLSAGLAQRGLVGQASAWPGRQGPPAQSPEGERVGSGLAGTLGTREPGGEHGREGLFRWLFCWFLDLCPLVRPVDSSLIVKVTYGSS